ncbi:hypothetical protein G7046_g505 [Stylonectria norvegica]|nr:hypothetical protein G7046_g505 [Stylonectria norvegica]
MSNLADETSAQSAMSEPVDLSTTPHSLARAVHARRAEYTQPRRLRIKIGTWNVAACPGTDKDLASWFVGDEALDDGVAALGLSQYPSDARGDSNHPGEDAESSQILGGTDIGLYVLGLQEMVDLNTTKDYMNRAVYTDTSAREKWKAAMEAATPSGYELITIEQMTGLLLLVYASPEIAATISNVSTKQVGTGLLGYFGNKGAVTTRLLLGETTRLVFVNCHLASGAGLAYLDRRCWDVGQILSKTQFDPIVHSGVEEDEGDKIGDEDFAFWFGDLNFRLDGLPGNDIRRLLTLHTQGEYDLSNDKSKTALSERGVVLTKSSDSDDDTTTTSTLQSREESFDSESSLPDPDDFPEDPSQDPASLQATLDSLLPHDQLRRVIKQRKLFHDGWREGAITFLPTYKYDVGTVALYDSSEKQRAPSWCDRVLFRTRKDKQEFETRVKEEEEARRKDEEMKSRGIEEDDDVLFSYADTDGDDNHKELEGLDYDEYDENEDPEPEDVETVDGFRDRIGLNTYTSFQRIISSDHKPIVSTFTLDYDSIVPELKAKVHAEVARELDRAENEGRPGITVVVEGGMGDEHNGVEFGDVIPLELRTSSLTVANTGGVSATFSFAEKPSLVNEEEAMPEWLSTTFVRADEESLEPLGKSITLDPGETVVIEDVLVLRIEDGRDHFISVRGTWLPTCLGRSIDELIRIPDGGIRKLVSDKGFKGAIPYDSEVHCSAPKELFKLTEATQTLAERCIADEMMLEEALLPREPGWPIDPTSWKLGRPELQGYQVTVVAALDTDQPLIEAIPVELPSSHKLEIILSVLLLFLESLTDGIIPAHIWAKLSATLPNLPYIPAAAYADTKTHILDVLSSAPNHNIAFVFLIATLSRVASELSPITANSQRPGIGRRLSFRRGGAEDEDAKKMRIREKRYAEVVAPLVCRVNEKEKGAKERARAMIEMFLRKDESG